MSKRMSRSSGYLHGVQWATDQIAAGESNQTLAEIAAFAKAKAETSTSPAIQGYWQGVAEILGKRRARLATFRSTPITSRDLHRVA